MRRSISRTFLVLVAVATTAWACGGSSLLNPTTPTPTTETFTGTLTPNGAVTFPFTSNTSGTVTATLTSFGPDSTLTVGLSLGTWSGTVCTVGTGLANDQAVQGSVVTATSSSAGSLCVRVYDVGTLTEALPFVVTVVHP